MRNRFLALWVLLSVFGCLTASPVLAKQKRSGFEVGLKLGLPVLMVPMIGFWRPFNTPILFRVGSILLTSEADLGVVLDSVGSYRQYVAASAGVAAWSDGSLKWYGLKYGGVYGLFFFEAGVANSPTGNAAYEFLTSDNSDPQIYPIFQLGIVAHL